MTSLTTILQLSDGLSEYIKVGGQVIIAMIVALTSILTGYMRYYLMPKLQKSRDSIEYILEKMESSNDGASAAEVKKIVDRSHQKLERRIEKLEESNYASIDKLSSRIDKLFDK